MPAKLTLRRLFRRKKKDPNGKSAAVQQDAETRGPSAETTITTGQPQPNVLGRTITREEMQVTANDQSLSPFFAKLPLELRRQIYLEVWRGYLHPRSSGGRWSTLSGASTTTGTCSTSTPTATVDPGADFPLHIYTDGSPQGTLRHTQCRLHTGGSGRADVHVADPWPFATATDNTAVETGNTVAQQQQQQHNPPRWFWLAWMMRLHWDKHWTCQHVIMKRWDPRTGNSRKGERAPFLPMFLSCKKMYVTAFPLFVFHPSL